MNTTTTTTTTVRSHRPAVSKTPRAWLMTLVAAPVLALALAGCVPGASPDAGTGASSQQAGSDTDPSSARDAYDRKLAECFRAQGLDVKDPLPGKGIVEDSPEIREAYPACVAEIGEPPTSSDTTVTPAILAQLLERAKCLREKGYEIQEPTTSDPGFIPAEVSSEDFESCSF